MIRKSTFRIPVEKRALIVMKRINNKSMPIAVIAKIVGVSPVTVNRILRHCNLNKQ